MGIIRKNYIMRKQALLNLTKMYVLSESEFHSLVLDAMDSLDYDVLTEYNCGEIAEEIMSWIENDDVNGFMIYQGDTWHEVYDVDTLKWLIYRKYLES